MAEYAEIIAAFTARVFLGLLFFFQGYDKVFNVKISGVIKTFEQPYRQTKLPLIFLQTGAIVTSFIELIGGLMLIFGLFKYIALYLLAIDILIATAALSWMNPMWDLKFSFPRLALLIFLLVIPADWDQWALDSLFG
jgi:putative oxidoreductase